MLEINLTNEVEDLYTENYKILLREIKLVINKRCFPGGSNGKEFTCNSGDLGLIPGLEGSPGGTLGNPLQYSCLENPHGQRSLAGYSPWGHKDSDMTERLSTNKWMPLISKVIYRFITISIQISTALLKKQKSQP